jgi:hypothetical protein
MMVVPDQPRFEIFQIFLFRMTYFHDPWPLPSPSTMMEGTEHHGMSMPLSTVEVAYSIIHVITEISSAHGDKNSASSNSNEVIHGTGLISQHCKKVKNYTK